MRVLGCLDGGNAEWIAHAAQMFTTAEPRTIGLLTVIDSGPREGMGRMRERFWRPPGELRAQAMAEAEERAAAEILDAAVPFVPEAERLVRAGRPELEIVNAAAEWRADVIVISARSRYSGPLHLGPHSVGHVARFVLDHAHCPVLLLRPRADEHFPIAR